VVLLVDTAADLLAEDCEIIGRFQGNSSASRAQQCIGLAGVQG